MKMTCNLPDHAAVVEALLEGFVLACQVCIAAGLAPRDPVGSGVLFRQEPAGEEDWKLPQNVVRDGWGDCEDLAGWRAGGLRDSGEDPGAKVVVVRTGKRKLHAVVQRSDGAIDDPSLDLARMEREGSMGGGKVTYYDKGQSPYTKSRPNRRANVNGRIVNDYRAAPESQADIRKHALATASRAPERAAIVDAGRQQAQSEADYVDRGDEHGRSVRSQGSTDPETAAGEGFIVDPATGAVSRMKVDQMDDYAQYGFDPSGKYVTDEEDPYASSDDWGEADAWGAWGDRQDWGVDSQDVADVDSDVSEPSFDWDAASTEWAP